MRYHALVIFAAGLLLLTGTGTEAQEQRIADSLALIYQQLSRTDTARLDVLRQLSFHEVRDYNRALRYANELIEQAGQTGRTKYQRMGYFIKGTKLRLLGRLDEALAAFFKSAELAHRTGARTAEGETYGAIADIYSVAGHHTLAKEYYNRAIVSLRQTKDAISLASALYNAGDELKKVERYDSALLYFKEALAVFEKENYLSGKAYCLGSMGTVYAALGRPEPAVRNIQAAIRLLEETEDYYPISDFLFSMADLYQNKGDRLRALGYTKQSLDLAKRYGLKEQIRDAYFRLSALYEDLGQMPEALASYKSYIVYRDSLNNLAAERRMADLRYNFGMSQKQAEVDLLNEQKRNEKRLSVLLALILGLTALLLAIVYRSYQTKQRAYGILDRQKQETDAQRAKAETALSELQRTQKQLIQSAKMASLGELTAGIAHEIQNPLNFVNNFSEVSVELLHELQEGSLRTTAFAPTEVGQILSDLTDNLQKINEHGKRADSIVKSMLQHSMIGTGKKEATDLNALADEYLRLSYHGLRAKDPSFRAELETRFDAGTGLVEVVPQELGRVFVNLYNNAFYAVREKQKEATEGYVPRVSVGTKRSGQQVMVTVRDNGTGIPQPVLDKIFQPFFTTKPPGQGTGLGLSLSYDIIKAHGGELTVETEEGMYTLFTIALPVTVKEAVAVA